MAIQPVCGQIPPIVWWGSWDVYRNNTFVVSAFIDRFLRSLIDSTVTLYFLRLNYHSSDPEMGCSLSQKKKTRSINI